MALSRRPLRHSLAGVRWRACAALCVGSLLAAAHGAAGEAGVENRGGDLVLAAAAGRAVLVEGLGDIAARFAVRE
jgi:hypothetical protein